MDWMMMLFVLGYVLIAALVMGVICKYESAGHEIGLYGLFAAFWPTLIVIAVIYFPVVGMFKLGESLFNFKKVEEND